MFNSSLGASKSYSLMIGKSAASKNSGYIGYNHSGTDGSNTNFLTFGHFQSDYLLNILGNGNVGIGTTNPSWLLTVYAASASQFTLSNATRNFILTNNAGDGLLSFNYASVNRLQFDTTNQWFNTGNVGIGTTSPSLISGYVGLNVVNSGYTQIKLQSSASSAGIEFKPSSGNSWELQANTSSQWFVYDRTQDIVRLLINSSGNVGIGTASPSQKLHVVGTAYSDTDFRAPIFYDSNDTGYFLNPNSTSNLNNLRAATISAANHGLTCVYYGGGATPTNGYLITTNIDYSTFNMPTVIIEGYAYGNGVPIHLEIVWYAYNNSWTNLAYTNLGNWNPGTVSIGTNASGKVCLHLSSLIYYGRFNVRCIYDQGNAPLEGWTVTDATTSALTRVTTISKVELATSITGNAATTTNGLTTSNYVSYSAFTGSVTSGANITATGYVYASTYLQTAGNLIYPSTYGVTQRLEVSNAANNAWIDGLTIAPGGIVTAYGDSRAPIFYDTANTAYYVDPASTSVLNALTIGGNTALTTASTLTAGNLSGTIPSGVLGNSTHYVGTTAIALNRASAGQTLTGISIDGNSGGIYAAGGAYIQTTSTGTSYGSHIQVREAAGGGGLTSEIYAPALGFHWAAVVASSILMESSGRIAIRDNPGTSYENFIANIVYGNASVRSPIFYDSNNTAYYLDPASTSNLVGLTVANTITGAISGNAGTATTLATARTLTIGSTGKTFNGSADVSWSTTEIVGYTPAYGTAAYQSKSLDTITTPGLYQYDGVFAGTKPPDNGANYRTIEIGSGSRFSQIAMPWNSDGYYFRRYDGTSFSTWRTVLHDGNYNSYAPTLTGTGASGSWGISVTGSSASCTGNSATVTINYNNDSNASYQMLWGSGNSVYGTAGVTLNPATDYITAASFKASDWFRALGNTGLYFEDKGYGITSAGAAGNSYGNASTYSTGLNGWQGWGIGSRHCMMSTGGDNFGVHDNTRSWLYYWNGTYHNFQYGYLESASSVRAPLFYDSNDTGYYCDPASTSRLNILSVGTGGITINGAATATDRNLKIKGASSTGVGIVLYDSADTFRVQLYGETSNYGFLDSLWGGWDTKKTIGGNLFLNNNTTYYLNPPSTTNLNNLTVAGTMTFGSLAYTTESRRSKNSSNVDIETVTGLISPSGPTFLEIRGFCPPTMYRTTADRPAPYGLGFGNGAESGGIMPIGAGDYLQEIMLYGANSGPTIFTFKRQLFEGATYDASYSNYYSASVFSINTGTGVVTASTDIRAPIFYDSNNTAYYVDPASTSVMNQINLAGILRRTASAAGYLEGNYPTGVDGNSSSAIYTIGGGYQPAATNLGNMYGCGYTVGNGTANPGLGATGWGFYVAGGGVSRIFLDSEGGYGIASSSWRAPIFYDSNNTAYYTDPASTSNLLGLTVTNTITGSITGNAGGSSASCTGNAATVTNGVYTGTTNTFTGGNLFQSNLGTTSGSLSSPPLQVYATGTNAAFMSFHRAGSYAVNMGLDSDNVLRIGGWSASANRLQLDMSGNLTIAAGMYATGFYDTNNTALYCDPTGTSLFTGLTVTNTITGSITGNAGGSSASCTGNAATATTTTGNAGSVTYLPNRTDSAVYQVLWGAAYTNGSGTIAYSCSPVYIQSSTGTLYANAFYDAGNTAFYVDPASTSILNAVRTRNTYGERVTVTAASSTTIDTQYNLTELTMSAFITTLTFSNLQASGIVHMWTIVTLGNGSATSVTWPAAIKWPGGTAPNITGTNTKRDIYQFVTYDGGTNIYAIIVGQNL